MILELSEVDLTTFVSELVVIVSANASIFGASATTTVVIKIAPKTLIIIFLITLLLILLYMINKIYTSLNSCFLSYNLFITLRLKIC